MDEEPGAGRSRGGSRRRRASDDVVRSTEALLRRLANEAERAFRLKGSAGDLAADAFAVWWESEKGEGPPAEEQARDLIRRLAQDESQRRRRNVVRLREAARSGAAPPVAEGIPLLCPGLRAFEAGARSPIAFGRALLAAASTVALEVGVLRGRHQFRLLQIAYVRQYDLDEAARLLKTSSGAIRKRLYRISSRLEDELLCRLEGELPAEVYRRVVAVVNSPGSKRRKKSVEVSPDVTRLWEPVQSALEALGSRNPGFAAS